MEVSGFSSSTSSSSSPYSAYFRPCPNTASSTGSVTIVKIADTTSQMHANEKANVMRACATGYDVCGSNGYKNA